MAVEKKILKNRPFQGANAQYNFEDNVNLGVDPLGKLDVENDLYSTVDDSIFSYTFENNLENILYTGLGSIEIMGPDDIENPHDNGGSWLRASNNNNGADRVNFRMYWLDDILHPWIEELINYDGGNILNFKNPSTNQIQQCGQGGAEGSGGAVYDAFHDYVEDVLFADASRILEWDPDGNCDFTKSQNTKYSLINLSHDGNCKIKSSFSLSDVNALGDATITDFPFSTIENDSGTTPWFVEELNNIDVNSTIIDAYSFINHPDANYFNIDGAFYIFAYIAQCRNAGNDSRQRDKQAWLFRLPKRDIYDVWATGIERTIIMGGDADGSGYIPGNNPDLDESGDEYDYQGCGAWINDGDEGYFDVMKLKLKITPPQDYESGIEEYYLDAFRKFYGISDNFLFEIREDSSIKLPLFFTLESFAFRPITTIESSQEFDLQSYYENKQERNQTSAPNQVGLRFDIAEDLLNFNINLIDEDEWGDINFKAFVVNWDWRDGEPETWSEITSDFPSSEPELELRRSQDNTYVVSNITESINHFYQTPGIKIIKAVVFSYSSFDDDDEYYIPIEFKVLTIKINLSVDAVYLEDFGDIGGFDYTFIPFPQTTPIIGGISQDSLYVNTLKSTIKQNKFRQDELLDKTLALNSLENDELGEYFGKSDIAQMRYFKGGSYDMNKLLMLYDDLLITDNGDGIVFRTEFHPYYDYEYWEQVSYPQESCIGTLFINDNMNQELRQNIVIELNMDEIDERTIRDSSGSGYKGLVLSDYAIKKDSKDIRVRRETETTLPEIDTEEKAF